MYRYVFVPTTMCGGRPEEVCSSCTIASAGQGRTLGEWPSGNSTLSKPSGLVMQMTNALGQNCLMASATCGQRKGVRMQHSTHSCGSGTAHDSRTCLMILELMARRSSRLIPGLRGT